jgi:hypothetical protein
VLTARRGWQTVRTIELGEEEAMFVAVELAACAPRDRFTREFAELVFATWPEKDGDEDDDEG